MLPVVVVLVLVLLQGICGAAKPGLCCYTTPTRNGCRASWMMATMFLLGFGGMITLFFVTGWWTGKCTPDTAEQVCLSVCLSFTSHRAILLSG